MRVGLLSDIHGNVAALTPVLEAMRREGMETILCAGDIVGYYYHPDQCLELLSQWDVKYVKGNHEAMLEGALESPSRAKEIRARYGSGVDVAVEVLSGPQRDFLVGLPSRATVNIDGTTFLVCHGAPWDNDAYIYPDAPPDVFERCADLGADFVILGHTHYPLSKRVRSTTIINPGSVGQARGTGRGVASWAFVDLETGTHRHESTPYDTTSVIAEARRRDPKNEYLRTILTDRP